MAQKNKGGGRKKIKKCKPNFQINEGICVKNANLDFDSDKYEKFPVVSYLICICACLIFSNNCMSAYHYIVQLKSSKQKINLIVCVSECLMD